MADAKKQETKKVKIIPFTREDANKLDTLVSNIPLQRMGDGVSLIQYMLELVSREEIEISITEESK